jgi:hypothetical protein
VDTGAVGGATTLDDDLAPTGGLAGDPIAVDDTGTGTAGVGDQLDPHGPGSGTVDDPDSPDDPRRPVV